MKKQENTISPEQALVRLQRLCSQREKCTDDVRKKLQEWKILPEKSEEIIRRLQKDQFVDDARYARAFVHDKFELAGWGMLKIRNALILKKIDNDIIRDVLLNVDSLAVKRKLEHLLTLKNKTLKSDLSEVRKMKLLRFATGRGFDYQMTYELISKLLKI